MLFSSETDTLNPLYAIRLLCQVQGQNMVFLVDFGRTRSLVSTELATTIFSMLASTCDSEDGQCGLLQLTQMIPACQWQRASAQFITPLKIFPIKCYDGIMGMDWLGKHNPMHVDWEAKWLALKMNGNSVCLQGETTLAPCFTIMEAHLTQP